MSLAILFLFFFFILIQNKCIDQFTFVDHDAYTEASLATKTRSSTSCLASPQTGAVTFVGAPASNHTFHSCSASLTRSWFFESAPSRDGESGSMLAMPMVPPRLQDDKQQLQRVWHSLVSWCRSGATSWAISQASTISPQTTEPRPIRRKRLDLRWRLGLCWIWWTSEWTLGGRWAPLAKDAIASAEDFQVYRSVRGQEEDQVSFVSSSTQFRPSFSCSRRGARLGHGSLRARGRQSYTFDHGYGSTEDKLQRLVAGVQKSDQPLDEGVQEALAAATVVSAEESSRKMQSAVSRLSNARGQRQFAPIMGQVHRRCCAKMEQTLREVCCRGRLQVARVHTESHRQDSDCQAGHGNFQRGAECSRSLSCGYSRSVRRGADGRCNSADLHGHPSNGSILRQDSCQTGRKLRRVSHQKAKTWQCYGEAKRTWQRCLGAFWRGGK